MFHNQIELWRRVYDECVLLHLNLHLVEAILCVFIVFLYCDNSAFECWVHIYTTKKRRKSESTHVSIMHCKPLFASSIISYQILLDAEQHNTIYIWRMKIAIHSTCNIHSNKKNNLAYIMIIIL